MQAKRSDEMTSVYLCHVKENSPLVMARDAKSKRTETLFPKSVPVEIKDIEAKTHRGKTK